MPAWFWVWARWYLGRGEFKGHARDPRLRPASAPKWIAPKYWAELVRRFLSMPKPSLFASDGLFIVNLNPDGTISGVKPYDWALQARAAGFVWVSIQILSGLTKVNVDRNLAWSVSELRRGGLVVGAWGRHNNLPVSEASLAKLLVHNYGFSFYVADLEEEYKVIVDGAGRSETLIGILKEAGVPLAFSTYSDCRPMPVKTWLETGDVIIQSYWNEGDEFRPADGIAQAHDAGVPADRLRISCGVHASKQVITPAQYRADIPSEVKGLSVYPAEVADLKAWQ